MEVVIGVHNFMALSFSFEVHLVIQAVISSRSHLALQTSVNGELLFLLITATVAANSGQIFLQIIEISNQSAFRTFRRAWSEVTKRVKADGSQEAHRRQHN